MEPQVSLGKLHQNNGLQEEQFSAKRGNCRQRDPGIRILVQLWLWPENRHPTYSSLQLMRPITSTDKRHGRNFLLNPILDQPTEVM